MGRINTFSRYLLVGAMVAASIAAFHALPAKAGNGYDGLIAPSDEEDKPAADTTPSHTEDYKGPGYAGLIASPDGETTAEEPAEPQRSLESQAMINGLREQGEAAVASVHYPPMDYSRLDHGTINGVNDNIVSTKRTVDQALSTVNDSSLSDSIRTSNARKAYSSLSVLAAGYRSKQQIPDSVFKQMGLSDKFISDEKAGNETSLAQLNAALDALKPYQ